MYGGGFATIPAYLRDLFGTMHVGAIHGRLLTAWSVAGVLGPVLVNYIREYQIDHGVPKAEAYNVDHVPDGRPAAHRLPLQPRDEGRPRPLLRQVDRSRAQSAASRREGVKMVNNTPRLLIAWIYVGIPLLWGVIETGSNALKLFQ